MLLLCAQLNHTEREGGKARSFFSGRKSLGRKRKGCDEGTHAPSDDATEEKRWRGVREGFLVGARRRCFCRWLHVDFSVLARLSLKCSVYLSISRRFCA